MVSAEISVTAMRVVASLFGEEQVTSERAVEEMEIILFGVEFASDGCSGF